MPLVTVSEPVACEMAGQYLDLHVLKFLHGIQLVLIRLFIFPEE